MVKATIFAVATAALQVLTAERALKLDRHVADMQVVSSDANSNTLKLGFNKAVVIDLSADIKDILVADPGTVKVILRTARRVYIVGAAPRNTSVFFYGDDGRQIAALDVWVLESVQPPPLEFDRSPDRQQRREPVSRRFF